MRIRKHDENGDIVFGRGRDSYLRNAPEAVAIAAKTRLSLWQNTWFTDLSDGTPWLENVLGKYPEAVYNSIIRKRILETQGVKAILEYESFIDENRRNLLIQCTIDTVYGEIYMETVI